MTDSLIHLRVPAALKSRWIRESRAAGLRLTDWIIQRVEADMAPTIVKFSIPAGMAFADLRLARDADGEISLNWDVIDAACAANGIDATTISENVPQLLNQWYGAHLAAGGDRDPVMDDLVAEARLEDERGGGIIGCDMNNVYDFGYTTLAGVVECVNTGPVQGFDHLTSDFLAASYAASAAIEGSDDITGIDADTIDAHLEFLSDAGGKFNNREAIRIGLALVAANAAP